MIARHAAWCHEIGLRDWAELERDFLTYYNMTSQH